MEKIPENNAELSEEDDDRVEKEVDSKVGQTTKYNIAPAALAFSAAVSAVSPNVAEAGIQYHDTKAAPAHEQIESGSAVEMVARTQISSLVKTANSLIEKNPGALSMQDQRSITQGIELALQAVALRVNNGQQLEDLSEAKKAVAPLVFTWLKDSGLSGQGRMAVEQSLRNWMSRMDIGE